MIDMLSPTAGETYAIIASEWLGLMSTLECVLAKLVRKLFRLRRSPAMGRSEKRSNVHIWASLFDTLSAATL